MWTPEYSVRYIDLPCKVDGVTIPNDDGTFDIYINSRHSVEHQAESLEHELEHIMRNHFYDDIRPVAQLEAEADRTPQDGVLPCIGVFTIRDAETRTRGNVARI